MRTILVVAALTLAACSKDEDAPAASKGCGVEAGRAAVWLTEHVEGKLTVAPGHPDADAWNRKQDHWEGLLGGGKYDRWCAKTAAYDPACLDATGAAACPEIRASLLDLMHLE